MVREYNYTALPFSRGSTLQYLYKILTHILTFLVHSTNPQSKMGKALSITSQFYSFIPQLVSISSVNRAVIEHLYKCVSECVSLYNSALLLSTALSEVSGSRSVSVRLPDVRFCAEELTHFTTCRLCFILTTNRSVFFVLFCFFYFIFLYVQLTAKTRESKQ